MPDYPLLTRRFIRLQAVLHLYAFYICKKANRDWALDQIHDDFTHDVFADPPADKARLAQELQQATALFLSSLMPPRTPPARTCSSHSHVLAVVDRAHAHYKRELAKDQRGLEAGFTEAVAKINQACVRIWQLLIEWAYIAKRQNERPKQSQQQTETVSVALAHSQVLQHLQNDGLLAQLVQQKAADWHDHLYLVENWYHQLVKPRSYVKPLAHPMAPHQDHQFLLFLIEDIIFRESDIQAFFGNVDLRWLTHKHIVRKLVLQGLEGCTSGGTSGSDLRVLDLVTHWQKEQRFYTNLVQRTLQEDAALEVLIAKTTTNWTVDRIMLMDKTIIKLALCEMLYFTDIPIRVSINEYIDLSKMYSMTKSSQFVNGLLDAIAGTL